MTLQAKFGCASALIAVLAICLAAFGVHAVGATSALIVRLYDQPLMGVNYARAANTTLTEARALAARGRMLGPGSLVTVLVSLQQMEKDIADDLRIVRERVNDASVIEALDRAEAAIGEWSKSENMIISPPSEGLTELPMPSAIDRQSAVAGALVDDLVELVAANGFAYRVRAEAEMRASNTTLVALAGSIVLLSSLTVGLFARLLIRPIRAATRIAENVAAGDFITIDVPDRRDEVGRLLTSLATMQGNLLDRALQAQVLIQEKDRTTDTLRHINLRFDTALNNMPHGLLMCDANARVIVVNRQFCAMYGIDPAYIHQVASYRELLELSIAAGNHPGRSADDIIMERRHIFRLDRRVTAVRTLANGRIIAVSHEPMPDGGWVAIYQDVTEQQRAEASITFMAYHDALTRLPNRVRFRERMEQAIAMAGRGSQFAVFCLDLDNFKQINDTMGHQVGDGMLIAVAERLQACLREGDTVARLGGDEFAIIQLAVHQPEDAEVLARRIIAAFGQPFELDERQIMAGISIGVTMAPADGVSYETLMRDADIALYQAKSDGCGTARFFDAEMDARISRRRVLERDIQGAIARNEFELYYQPQVDLSENKIVGFEALLRWHHPARGFVSPYEFIPVAEETGMIVAIGEWVLRTACFEAKKWPDDITVAVNLSPVQFTKSGLVAMVQTALDLSLLPPSRLELEITESVFLHNTANTLTALRQLRAMGIDMALDDFGTGYSSLSYLRSFPFNKIKIDQSFVRDLLTNKESMSIVRAVISLGQSLGMRTIAEGVETVEQLERLRFDGCEEVQGYYFSRPVPASEIPVLIENLCAVSEHIAG